ncbi:MAG TPA: beta-D-hydroxybutyrate dehydrogenase [Rhodospirillaceae bacterium]|nr:beta-D-hydroxybutyrate dehydrogenase [Rhodospirillaceae bacterium]HAT34700.1 beta-D-hydroxybutyrate dehydrogenase [Rhodospirillaceae bacterium]
MTERRSALITGSSRGIGAAMAEALAADGCNVMLNGFGDGDEIEAERKRLADTYNVDVAYNGADLGKEDQVDALFKATEEAFGAVDILVNNAVIRYFHAIEDFPRDEWRNSLDVNVTAPLILTQLALPGMKARGWGRIINFSSVMGLAGRSGRVDYITSKHAMLGLTRSTAAEVGEIEGITCNAICPGSVLTPNTEIKIAELGEEEGLEFEDAKRRYLEIRNQKLDYITPARVARLVAFLCEEASMDITGVALPIDQGRSATWLEV